MTIRPLLLPLFFGGLLTLNPLSFVAQDDMTPQEAAQKFGTLMRYVGQLYVDSVSVKELTERAIVTMLEDLDPHSTILRTACSHTLHEACTHVCGGGG